MYNGGAGGQTRAAPQVLCDVVALRCKGKRRAVMEVEVVAVVGCVVAHWGRASEDWEAALALPLAHSFRGGEEV